MIKWKCIVRIIMQNAKPAGLLGNRRTTADLGSTETNLDFIFMKVFVLERARAAQPEVAAGPVTVAVAVRAETKSTFCGFGKSKSGFE